MAVARRREVGLAPAAAPAVGMFDDLVVEDSSPDSEDPMALHERLVAYVHAVNGDPEPRAGVWMEHSYARGSPAAGGAAPGETEARTRMLLVPPRPAGVGATSAGDHVDVETYTEPAAPPEPLRAASPEPAEPESDDADEDEWEARVLAAAPDADARRAAAAAAEALRGMRLARLCGAGGARGAARVAAARLRRALAPCWRRGGGAWLHGALLAALPARARRLYGLALRELLRRMPALGARLAAGGVLPAPAPARPRAPPAVMPLPSRPLLVWLSSGRDRFDARWERRLRALVPTHYIRLPNQGACSVEAWCVARCGAARAALAALAGEEGALCLGGAGAGAALALLLAAGTAAVGTTPAPTPAPRALLLLAPPLLTAAGLRPLPDDPLAQVKIPTLLVVPEMGSRCWRGAAAAAAAAAAPATVMHSLVLGGADDMLRVSRARCTQLRVHQDAIDAALVDECARWLTEVTEAVDAGAGDADTDAHTFSDDNRAGVAMDEEYAHLPPAAPANPAGPANPAAPANSAGPAASNTRILEIAEGRVVSRVCGRTPLLLPARRPAAAASADDILAMPIVFADDSPPPASASAVHVSSPVASSSDGVKGAPAQVTVKSGGGARLRYSKVIVASRGPRGGSGSGSGSGSGGGAAVRLLRAPPPRPRRTP